MDSQNDSVDVPRQFDAVYVPSFGDIQPSEGEPDLSSDAFSPHMLQETLMKSAQDDERLLPFVALLEASTHPHAASTSGMKQAVEQIQQYNDDEASRTSSCEREIFTDTFREIQGAKELGIDEVEDCTSFFNWGSTVHFEASHTLVVSSVRGVQEVVKWARTKGRRVRVAGFRHSWSNIFGSDGDVIIMFLPYESLVQLPHKPPPSSFTTELFGIEIVREEGETALCKIMAGTTNAQLLEWSNKEKKWALDRNVIMIEITVGGSNAPICHGAGFATQTLSDLVEEMTYVDAHGELRTISDPADLRVAAGCFGLLGIVISLTLRLHRQAVAEMVPVKLLLPLTIPPPRGYNIPAEVREMIRKRHITAEDMEQARVDFIRRCEEHDYLEWFWFPYQNLCWINTWKKRPMTDQDVNIAEYPGKSWLTGVKSQELQGTITQLVTSYTPWKWLPGYLQAYALGLAATAALPNVTKPSETIRAYLSDGLHFRRGIQNFQCLDTEWEIPIPLKQGKRDYELIQRAWWDAITAMYADKKAPVRLALEMRLMGDSNITLAPQRGNQGGTIAIEVLTTKSTPDSVWASFKQTIANVWTSYTDDKGERLNARPHWAKEWEGINVHGKPIARYLKEDAYATAFAEFQEGFERIVKGHQNGPSVSDTLAMFGTQTMQQLIWD